MNSSHFRKSGNTSFGGKLAVVSAEPAGHDWSQYYNLPHQPAMSKRSAQKESGPNVQTALLKCNLVTVLAKVKVKPKA